MNDEFAGVGGQYVVDDATQTRRRVEGPPAPASEHPVPAVPAPEVATEPKE